ncbi:hypothetical protein GOP47_0006730 [Adiantum capillus-veneris]|uniref:Peptidase C14 caspase domain-containing protein n=1 Tax=Adiantum capillus-veneris TaxID=13818 RepID=A0A9D4ZKP9_ADICA|nr:hypothetical protein GOP47_0006145 [Adiantum capillus-veneris]KAI5079059.1 hypothetical protein GOP47_0006730 [Adiantum capillus-veneris]
MAKKAVMVGCNYPGTKAELHGCINDVWRMHKALIERFGFDEQDITVLIDTDDQYTQPTGANIKRALHDMVTNSQSGDVLFFHYSGHGTRLPAETGEDDDTGYDECIVPCDMNLINDEDFRELIDKLPKGVAFTIVSDSCHSGGLIEDTKEQIGDSFDPQREPEVDPLQFGDANRGVDGGYEEENEGGGWGGLLKKGFKKAWESDSVRDAMGIGRREKPCHGDDSGAAQQVYLGGDDVEVKNKALSLDTLIDMLKDKTGRQDIEVGSIRPTLYDTFGEDSSSKVKKFVQVMMGRLQKGNEGKEGEGGGFMGVMGGLAAQFLQNQLNQSDDSDAYLKPAMQTDAPSPQAAYAGVKPGTRIADMGVLVSGCQSDQTSADAKPGGDATQAYGALSNAIQTILASSEPGQPIPNRHLVTEARRLLVNQGYTQQPGLYCADQNRDAPFIC